MPNFFGTKIAPLPQKIFFQVKKVNGTTAVVSGDIEDCTIDMDVFTAIMTLKNIVRYDKETKLPAVISCPKCKGRGLICREDT